MSAALGSLSDDHQQTLSGIETIAEPPETPLAQVMITNKPFQGLKHGTGDRDSDETDVMITNKPFQGLKRNTPQRHHDDDQVMITNKPFQGLKHTDRDVRMLAATVMITNKPFQGLKPRFPTQDIAPIA